jgi:pSer/pThr/pTyr-binding forkhead associated (FHA) protein
MTAMLIGRTGRVAGREFSIGESARLGASSDTEIRIALEGISRQHARVFAEAGAYWIEDAGSTNGTFVNKRRVRRDRLQHLDVVTLGRAVDLIFLIRAGQVASPERRVVTAASLSPLDGPDAGTTIEIPLGELVLGRASSNSIVVDHSAVSKVHARVSRSNELVSIQDLGSANGTYVNDRRLETAVVLKTRDRVSLAGVRTFEVRISRDPAAGPVRETETAAGVSAGPVFDQEWKTRLMWSAEELAQIQAEIAQAKAPPAAAPAAPAAAPAQKPAAAAGPAVQRPAPATKPAAPAKPAVPGAPAKAPASVGPKPPAATAPKAAAGAPAGAPQPPADAGPAPTEAMPVGREAAHASRPPALAVPPARARLRRPRRPPARQQTRRPGSRPGRRA